MKYLLLFLLFIGCDNPEMLDKCDTPSDPFANAANVDETKPELTIGSKYTICGPPEKNPFEKQGKATVIITDMKDGYVQYCWDYEYKQKDAMMFSRSEKEFIEQINWCK